MAKQVVIASDSKSDLTERTLQHREELRPDLNRFEQSPVVDGINALLTHVVDATTIAATKVVKLMETEDFM